MVRMLIVVSYYSSLFFDAALSHRVVPLLRCAALFAGYFNILDMINVFDTTANDDGTYFDCCVNIITHHLTFMSPSDIVSLHSRPIVLSGVSLIVVSLQVQQQSVTSIVIPSKVMMS